MVANNSKRYGEADLLEFKAHIEKKLAKAERQLSYMVEQLEEAAESKDSQGDWMDDSSSGNDMEMLQTMANRQRKHILDLQNALQRIHNKSYGICVISGELIDKRRLLAVPTTTKSLEAKLAVNQPAKKPKVIIKPPISTTPKIISRVISKKTTSPNPEAPNKNTWDEDEEDLIDDITDLKIDEEVVDLDNYSEEDLDN